MRSWNLFCENSLTGILLVNLGTPNSPHPRDVYRYLIEFLTDERVMDIPWFSRQLLVRGLIVPFRYRQSAKSYQQIWTVEGSPLKVYGLKVRQELQKILGDAFRVELAMRYQEPSIDKGIATLLEAGVKCLVVFPLFPHYASATTGSVHQRVMEILRRYPVMPELVLIRDFPTHSALIDSFCTIGRQYPIDNYDHILFSFHGLPQKHIFNVCAKVRNPLSTSQMASGEACCCANLCEKNQACYSAQCHATARAIAHELQIEKHRYTICFQSRLGKDPWIQPYTCEIIPKLAQQGKKRVLVFCPAFVCDCLETLFEIGVEYAAEFKHAGGDTLDLVQGLNDHPRWIQALKEIVLEHVPQGKKTFLSSAAIQEETFFEGKVPVLNGIL
jgi:protoporphyrin/coproporphyrin ferrochelatase